MFDPRSRRTCSSRRLFEFESDLVRRGLGGEAVNNGSSGSAGSSGKRSYVELNCIGSESSLRSGSSAELAAGAAPSPSC